MAGPRYFPDNNHWGNEQYLGSLVVPNHLTELTDVSSIARNLNLGHLAVLAVYWHHANIIRLLALGSHPRGIWVIPEQAY